MKQRVDIYVLLSAIARTYTTDCACPEKTNIKKTVIVYCNWCVLEIKLNQ